MHKALKKWAIPSSFWYHLPPPNPTISIITIPKVAQINSAGIIRFTQSESRPGDEMDPQKQSTNPESRTLDTMSSFGEGYATRSDEEGFGGIYAGNQYFSNKKEHQPPEFDDEQGSDVKEKEKGRNQEKVAP